MKSVPLLLAGASLALANECPASCCQAGSVSTTTEYVTIVSSYVQTIYTWNPYDTMYPGPPSPPKTVTVTEGSGSSGGSGGSGGNGGNGGNGGSGGQPVTVTETEVETAPAQTITEPGNPGSASSAPPTMTPIYQNTTYRWNSTSSTSTWVPTYLSSSMVYTSPTSKAANATSSSSSLALNTTSSSSSLAPNPTSSSPTSTSVLTCADACATSISLDTAVCSSIFLTTITPTAVTVTSYATEFPYTAAVSTTVSTETDTDTELFTAIETLTTETDIVSAAVSTTIETDVVATITDIISTVTEVATIVPRGFVQPTSIVQDVCTDIAASSSACICAGFASSTVTLSASTVVVTSTASGTTTTTDDLTTTTETTIQETLTNTLDVDFTSIVDFTSTIESIVTATTNAVATATVTGNAYCSDGSLVNGGFGSCGSGPCVTFNLRIEGASDTVYEGDIRTGPMDITTASGGTHLCDGTNNGANPSPAGTGITCLASAEGLCGFTFDGTYSASFSDFFITRIGTSDSNTASNEYWGILENFVFTPAGGCETEPPASSELLWAFNAFNVNYFLDIQPRTATLAPGASTTFTVTGNDGNGGSTPLSGASFNGQTSNGNGQVAFTAPTVPGSYRYKASRSDSIRSPAVVITVA